VVLRALEQKPELRYQQASVLKTQVETIVATSAAPPGSQPSPGYTPPSRSGRHASAAVMSGLAIWVLATIASALVVPFQPPRYEAVVRVDANELRAVIPQGAGSTNVVVDPGFLAAQREVIRSDQVLEAAVEKLEPANLSGAEALHRLRESTDVRAGGLYAIRGAGTERRVPVLDVSVIGERPGLTKIRPNAIVRAYGSWLTNKFSANIRAHVKQLQDLRQELSRQIVSAQHELQVLARDANLPEDPARLARAIPRNPPAEEQPFWRQRRVVDDLVEQSNDLENRITAWRFHLPPCQLLLPQEPMQPLPRRWLWPIGLGSLGGALLGLAVWAMMTRAAGRRKCSAAEPPGWGLAGAEGGAPLPAGQHPQNAD
jgi:hypothetical protein